MEKGIIYDLQKFSIHDGPGIRTVVFFKGCPLSCQWCANPESQKKSAEILWIFDKCQFCNKCIQVCPNRLDNSPTCLETNTHEFNCVGCGACVEVCLPRARKLTGKIYTTDEVLAQVKKDIAFYKRSGGGVTFSGGEPFNQPEFLIELLEKCKKININTAIETSGYTNYENIHKACDKIDFFFYDIKHMDSAIHYKYTNVGNELILKNLKKLSKEPSIKEKRNIVIRVPLISNINDSIENIKKTIALCSELDSIKEIELLCYHKLGIPKYKQLRRNYLLEGAAAPNKEKLSQIAQLLESDLDKKIEWKITE